MVAPQFLVPKSPSGARSLSPLGSYSRPIASPAPPGPASRKNFPAVRASQTSAGSAWSGPDLPTADGSAPSYLDLESLAVVLQYIYMKVTEEG